MDFHETRNVFDTGMASLLTISIGYSQCCKISFSLLWIASEMASWYALVVTCICNICRGICTGHVKTTICNLCYEYCLLWFHWLVFCLQLSSKTWKFYFVHHIWICLQMIFCFHEHPTWPSNLAGPSFILLAILVACIVSVNFEILYPF